MKQKFILLVVCSLCFGLFMTSCSKKRKGDPRVLVFSKTEGFHHASIPDGIKAIQKLGKENGFLVDTTTNAAMFTEDTLKKYSAVIFLSTTGNVLNMSQQKDFERYIQAGGGYVGVHAAADCEYHWPWYGKLVGAYFKSHPHQQEAKLDIHKDSKFPITDSLPNPWVRKDEWYNFRQPPASGGDTGVHVLVSIDEKSYEGGENGDYHPMVWYHDYDGGRAFYMELGHTKESYSEPNFLELLLEGIQYAIGKNKVLDYDDATALRVPDENRFSKKFLAGGLFEPTEITVLPNLDVLIAERRGGIKFYDHSDNTIKEVAHLDVYYKTLHTKGVNVEMGLLGLQADPHYDQNHWVYVYYSPSGSKSVDRLSRFKFENNHFNVKSEQVILEVNTRRETCCHTGGSIAFDGDGNLYVSVGDNTTPFDEKNPETGKAFPINTHGFAPLDDRPGFEHYDDRRAAGNTNDLRGKILRIHVNEDGSYSIPEGNLFPPEDSGKTRPEIYVMGDRNPYRISVDKHTGYLYWGEVGPDASNDSLATRGPRGYDEVNQARKAGNFGWPYFVGNNYAYHEYNYATGETGPAFDPNHVVNNSRNNTGLKNLPPAQPAFIWYPYAQSPDFPILGTGGRTAMAGPVYYVDDYPEETRFPEYYNGKLFIYDWIRNWIMVVTMNKEGDLQTIEPFMEHTTFHNISDMEAGPDGKLYIVEYGEGWFQKNPDAALSVITYNGGNRAPKVTLHVNQEAGGLPLKIHAAADASDPDGNKLSFVWHFGKNDSVQTEAPEATHTFTTAGVYPVSVTVSDGKGAETNSTMLHVYAGNSKPDVNIHFAGNPTFYFPGQPVNYQVEINDKEDGSPGQPGFDQSRIFVKASYLQSADKAALSTGQLEGIAANLSGKSLMESLDCKSCHKMTEKSIGPAFHAVAEKYKNETRNKVLDHLSNKIIKGGSGVWGETAMPAHPGLSVADAKKIVSWVMSLNEDSNAKEKSLPLKGTIDPDDYKLTSNGALYLTASYVDKGANGVPSITGSGNAILRNPLLQATSAKASPGISNSKVNDYQFKMINDEQAWIEFPQISLQDVNRIKINYGLGNPSEAGWKVEVHLDDPQGKLLGETTIGSGIEPRKPASAQLRLQQEAGNGLHDVYFVFKKNDASEQGGLAVSSMLLETR